MKKIEDSLTAFEVYKSNYNDYVNEDLSESDTRSKLVDALLIDVLGWDEKDIRREGHTDHGFYDYRISIPGINIMVEAKKQFKSLELPNYHSKTTIKVLLKNNSEVINQVRGYALDEGVPYVIVINGHQIIIFKTFSEGKSWKDNSALIYDGIDDIENRFVEFYENLSKYSILHNGGFKFDLPIYSIEGKTILSSIVDAEKELIRNPLSAVLGPLIEHCFGEMFSLDHEDDLKFIKYCFVENDETKKNKSEIERLFSDTAPEIGNIIPAVNSNNLANQIASEITNYDISLASSAPKPIIIIGSKGAGKSTFINHLFKYKFENEEFENHFIIYIDFRKFYATNNSFEPEKIGEEILESIFSKYEDLELHTLKVLKRIYFKEIKRNNESIWQYDKDNDEKSYQKKLSDFLEDSRKKTLTHLELLSKYLIRERRRRLIIIIDNADQFNDSIQEKLFLFAHSLTRSTLCGTVISLREGYYRKWQNSPPFDAYESNIYHITAPKYALVLEKRIDFAIEKGNKNPITISSQTESGKAITLTTEYANDFLGAIKTSLFLLENSPLLDFINLTTYPNIREGLRIFKIFLTSGHTKIQDYVERQQNRINYQTTQIIPIHEFIKSIALQNRHYYNSETSILYNLFTPPLDSTDHFLKIYLLKDLNDLIENRASLENLISSRVIIDKLSSLGYKINTIQSTITSLLKSSLIDTDEQLSDIEWIELPAYFNLRITAKGHYYLNEMINRFLYCDLVFQDTPIFDPEWFNSLQSVFPTSNAYGFRNFEYRKAFVRKFLEYLKACERKQPNQVLTVYGSVVDKINSSVNGEIDKL